MIYNRNLGRSYRLCMPPDAIDELRCSGRTTAIALSAIAECLRNGGEWVEIKDHHQTALADRQAIDHTMNCVKLLGLSFFERDRNRIRCTQFTTNPWEIA